MLLRPFSPLVTAHRCASTRTIELVGRNRDVSLITLSPLSSTESLNEVVEAITANDGHSHIRSSVLALTSAFRPLPLESYGSLTKITSCTKPTIALVDGDIMGVAAELAMSCDIIYASDRSSFALNQILMGSIPGSGGTQRLPRAVGKSLAMEMILSGESLSAADAKMAGLISKVVPIQRLLKEGISLAERTASKSCMIQPMAKEAVSHAFDTSLREGCLLERKLFESTFATKDRLEGMTAHLDGRKPVWLGE